MEVLEGEVAEKKSKQIFVEVAKACSVGAQMTLIMGWGALLSRCCGQAHGPAVHEKSHEHGVLAPLCFYCADLYRDGWWCVVLIACRIHR